MPWMVVIPNRHLSVSFSSCAFIRLCGYHPSVGFNDDLSDLLDALSKSKWLSTRCAQPGIPILFIHSAIL
jgi:hypothetical protein